MAKIKLYELGKTGMKITPIGLGTWQFSEGKFFNAMIWDTIPNDVRDRIVEAALKGGISWFDTAEAYGMGASERGLSKSLQNLGVDDKDVFIATKWFPIFRTAGNLKRNIKKRIKALDPYSIDLHQIHQPFALSSIKSQSEVMGELLGSGKIKSIGISNFNADKMETMQQELDRRDNHLASNQMKYSILDRRIEGDGVLDYAKENSTTIIAYTPLEWGVLTGAYQANPSLIDGKPVGRRKAIKKKMEKSGALMDLISQIANTHSSTPSQVALNWLTNFHGETVVAIPGASKVSHVEQNVGSMKISLSKEEMNTLDEMSQEFI